MQQIWLVRHGESEAQTGADDDPRNPQLTERGREQARRLREALDDIAFDRILVSPLTRAWQTYELSGVDRSVAQFDSRVMESEWGDPEFYAGVLPLSPPEIAAPDRHHAYDRTAEQRAAEVMDEVIGSDSQSCLIFGHWGICGRLFMAFIQADLHNWSLLPSMDNVGLSLLEVDDADRRWVRYWNDRSHVLDLLG